MNENLTDITLVMDRSGSMEARRRDAEGGVNTFIQEQAREPGEAVLTLVQFDTEYEVVHNGVAIHEVPRFTLRPRGATALLDAVGRAILETGKRLEAMPDWLGSVPRPRNRTMPTTIVEQISSRAPLKNCT